MSFSDEDPPRRRRRGRGRPPDDDGFDDFWSRERVGPRGRSRRKRDDAPTTDPGDAGDRPRPPAAGGHDPAGPPSGHGPDPARPRGGGQVSRPVGAQAALERRRAREQAVPRPDALGGSAAGAHGPRGRAGEPGRGGDPGLRPPLDPGLRVPPGDGRATAGPSRGGDPVDGDPRSGAVRPAGPYGARGLGPGDRYVAGGPGPGGADTRYGGGSPGAGDSYGAGDVGYGGPYGDDEGLGYGGPYDDDLGDGGLRDGGPYGDDDGLGYGGPYDDDLGDGGLGDGGPYGDDGLGYGGPYDDDLGDDDYFDDDAQAALAELPRRRGCRRALAALAVLAVAAVVAGWFAWSWVQGRIDPAGAPGEVVLVEIPEGTSTAGIGDVLADAGVISDATLWSWYTRVNDPGTIRAGRYEMRLDSSFDEAVEALKREPLPPEVERLVTVPPGLTQAQVAARLADPDKGVPGFTVEAVRAAMDDPAARSALLPAGKPLEGTLYPETYAVEEGDTPLDVIGRMVAELDAVAGELDLTGRAAAIGRTPYEVLVVASLVEREAGVPEDGPRIARVIYNRLAAGEPLGIDATSCYEVAENPCELTEGELADGTPYDTRSKPGLPPTPIASPGRASISAALHPAEGPWRWYVLDADEDDGSSYFTDDYDDFLAAKARCVEAGLGCG